MNKAAIGAGILGILWFLSRKANAMEPAKRQDIQLSPHFRLSEWLRSTVVPEVANYEPTSQEIDNARSLAINVLEPLRKLTGPIEISGGARPDGVTNKNGEDFYTALSRAGYHPARSSDHKTFNGVDIKFPGRGEATYYQAFEALQKNPRVRQVILEFHTLPDGSRAITHLHVSASVPGKPRFSDPVKMAHYEVDGQTVIA